MLGLNFVNFLGSIFKRQVNSSPKFASFFVVITHNSSWNFKLKYFLLGIKGSHQSPNFETFKDSGENLPNFSSHFPDRNSVFFQILHHSSVMQSLKFEKQTLGSKNDMMNFINFTCKSESLHFNVLLLSKVYYVWAKKKYRGVMP